MFKRCLIIIILNLTLFASSNFADNNLQGEWIAKKRSKGGLGTTYTFYKNGQLDVTIGPILESTYTVNKNTISLSMKDKKDWIKFQFEITDNNLKTIDNLQKIQRDFKRVGNDKLNNIIGRWEGQSKHGGKEIFIFTNDHKCIMLIHLNSYKGTYKTQGKQLTENLNLKSTIWKYSIKDKVLNLTSSRTNKEKEFIKSPSL